eukprot:s408_g3.t1
MLHTRKAGSGAYRSRAVVCGKYQEASAEESAGGADIKSGFGQQPCGGPWPALEIGEPSRAPGAWRLGDQAMRGLGIPLQRHDVSREPTIENAGDRVGTEYVGDKDDEPPKPGATTPGPPQTLGKSIWSALWRAGIRPAMPAMNPAMPLPEQ